MTIKHAFCLIVFLVLGAGLRAEAIKLATGEWAPYTSAALADYGFFTEIVSEVFDKMNVDVEYVFYPWRRCYDAVVKNLVWAAFPYSFTAERAKEVIYSDTIAYSTSRFFYYTKIGPGKSYKYQTMEDLERYRLGGVIGYFYEAIFEEAGLKVDYVAKELQAIEKLMLGRIELLPLNELVGWHLIEMNFPDEIGNFSTLAKPFNRSELHLIVSKSHPGTSGLLEDFNTVLEEVKKSEAYGLILEKYHLKE